MHGRVEGACLGAMSIMAIAFFWSAAAGTHDCPTRACVPYDPVPAGVILVSGLVLGVPCGLLVGGCVGTMAARMRHHRGLRLLIIAAVLACVLTGIARTVMHCCTDPSTSTLWLRAFVPLAIAASVLERWTRPPEPMPRATVR